MGEHCRFLADGAGGQDSGTHRDTSLSFPLSLSVMYSDVLRVVAICKTYMCFMVFCVHFVVTLLMQEVYCDH